MSGEFFEDWQAGACREIDALKNAIGQVQKNARTARDHLNKVIGEQSRELAKYKREMASDFTKQMKEQNLIEGELQLAKRNAKQSDIEFAELRRQLERAQSNLPPGTWASYSIPEPITEANDWAIFKDFRVRRDTVAAIERGAKCTYLECVGDSATTYHVGLDEMSYDEVVKVVTGE